MLRATVEPGRLAAWFLRARLSIGLHVGCMWLACCDTLGNIVMSRPATRSLRCALPFPRPRGEQWPATAFFVAFATTVQYARIKNLRGSTVRKIPP